MWARTCGGQPFACDAVATSSSVSANAKGCFQCKNELADGPTELKMLDFFPGLVISLQIRFVVQGDLLPGRSG
jgi:hypothetical protein